MIDLYTAENIMEIKADKMIDQNFRCAYCGKAFNMDDKIELAHILPQRKYLLIRYGAEIIHHPLNMALTHPGRCNSGVQISPHKTMIVEKHVDRIRAEISPRHLS